MRAADKEEWLFEKQTPLCFSLSQRRLVSFISYDFVCVEVFVQVTSALAIAIVALTDRPSELLPRTRTQAGGLSFIIP